MPDASAPGWLTSSACSIEVSAPSSRTSAHANGRSKGCCSIGSVTHANRSTEPVPETSTVSTIGSAVSGSYSVGGTSTFPLAVRAPTMRPSRSPWRNSPITGPELRRYGNSSFQVAATAGFLPPARATVQAARDLALRCAASSRRRGECAAVRV
jgi:hypothetical protein